MVPRSHPYLHAHAYLERCPPSSIQTPASLPTQSPDAGACSASPAVVHISGSLGSWRFFVFHNPILGSKIMGLNMYFIRRVLTFALVLPNSTKYHRDPTCLELTAHYCIRNTDYTTWPSPLSDLHSDAFRFNHSSAGPSAKKPTKRHREHCTGAARIYIAQFIAMIHHPILHVVAWPVRWEDHAPRVDSRQQPTPRRSARLITQTQSITTKKLPDIALHDSVASACTARLNVISQRRSGWVIV